MSSTGLGLSDEAVFSDQSQDIDAVRRAWQGCREECGELLARVAELEAKLEQARDNLATEEDEQAALVDRVAELEKSLEAAEDCINLAIAELEPARNYAAAIPRALALLKGER